MPQGQRTVTIEHSQQHIMAGDKGTPAMDQYLKNLRQGNVGQMKNALNTLWEYTKDPLTLGGSTVEDLIQNANKFYTRMTGKSLLKKKTGWNAIKASGQSMKQKLKDLEKALGN